jgi:hypothetical protein
VLAGVRGIGVDRVERDAADREGFQVGAPGSGRTWKENLEGGGRKFVFSLI